MGHFPPSLAFYRVRKGTGTIPYSYPTLSFYIIVFSISSWLVQGRNVSRRGYDGALGHLCFLLLSFCIWSNFWVEWKACLLGLSACLPASLVTDLTVLPRTQAGSCWVLTHCGSTWILCSWGTLSATCKWGCKEWLCLSLLLMFVHHHPIQLHLQNTAPKIKLLGISRKQ